MLLFKHWKLLFKMHYQIAPNCYKTHGKYYSLCDIILCNLYSYVYTIALHKTYFAVPFPIWPTMPCSCSCYSMMLYTENIEKPYEGLRIFPYFCFFFPGNQTENTLLWEKKLVYEPWSSTHQLLPSIESLTKVFVLH